MDQRRQEPSEAESTPSARRVTFSAILLLLVIILIGTGILFYRSYERPPLEILLPTVSPTSTELEVYVSGAIVRPGVYTLRQGDRVVDALDAAGGPTREADLARINLAAKVKDEQQIHVPRPGETFPQESSNEPQKININTASAAQLETLPGIGETKAQAIVNYRKQHGDFASIEDLVEVAGIGSSTFEKVTMLFPG